MHAKVQSHRQRALPGDKELILWAGAGSGLEAQQGTGHGTPDQGNWTTCPIQWLLAPRAYQVHETW